MAIILSETQLARIEQLRLRGGFATIDEVVERALQLLDEHLNHQHDLPPKTEEN